MGGGSSISCEWTTYRYRMGEEEVGAVAAPATAVVTSASPRQDLVSNSNIVPFSVDQK